MPGSSLKFFLDTNVLVYTFDPSEPLRRAQARELVERALSTRQGVISYQVVQEFMNVALRKFSVPLSAVDCRQYLDQVLVPLWRISPTPVFYRTALEIQEQSGYGFYDSLIVAAALEAGCGTLYSQDLQNGRVFGALTVVDPFAV